MKKSKLILILFFSVVINSFAQGSVTEITTKKGIRYITTSIDYPITGTYLFEGAEPTVELNANGTGFYQTHENPKRAMSWGIECNQTGEPIFIKGYDSEAYSLWFHYTEESDSEEDKGWNVVEFSIHFNSFKMFIQGERVKSFSATEKK